MPGDFLYVFVMRACGKVPGSDVSRIVVPQYQAFTTSTAKPSQSQTAAQGRERRRASSSRSCKAGREVSATLQAGPRTLDLEAVSQISMERKCEWLGLG